MVLPELLVEPPVLVVEPLEPLLPPPDAPELWPVPVVPLPVVGLSESVVPPHPTAAPAATVTTAASRIRERTTLVKQCWVVTMLFTMHLTQRDALSTTIMRFDSNGSTTSSCPGGIFAAAACAGENAREP